MPASPNGPDEAATRGALVQQARLAGPVAALWVRSQGVSYSLIAVTGPSDRGLGLLARGAERTAWGARLPSGSVRNPALESRLLGARLLGIGPLQAHWALRDGSHVVLSASKGYISVHDGPPLQPLEPLGEPPAHAWFERGEALVAAAGDNGIEVRRLMAQGALARARKTLERRCSAIRGDLEAIRAADGLSARAAWLLPEALKLETGARTLRVVDWSTGEAETLEVPLAPDVSPAVQVRAMFKRAKRLKRGQPVAEARLARTERSLAELTHVLERVATAVDQTALGLLLAEAKANLGKDLRLPTEGGAPAEARGGPRPGKGSRTTRRTPFRTFLSGSGTTLWVGKGAKDNDELTLHWAKPHDLWLHAKGSSGAHVVARLQKGQTPTPDDLVDAAHLAAHFSGGRGETLVEVLHAPRRYVRKPKGSPPGLVQVDRGKVLMLRVDPARLRVLLEREQG